MATLHSDLYYAQREKEKLVLNVDVLWRTGRRNPKNIYAQHSDVPTTDDPSIGYMDSGELARRAVEDHNRLIGGNK